MPFPSASPVSQAPVLFSPSTKEPRRRALAQELLANDSSGARSRLLVVILLTLLAAALRLHGIAADAFWKNELFSIYWIRNSFSFLATQGPLIETNPPLHYILLKLWTMAFGTGELSVRSLSALPSIASVPLIYVLGRELSRPAVGLVAAAMLAVSPMHIYFAQEARGYALLPLFMILLMLGALRLMREMPPSRGTVRNSGVLLYVAGSLGLLYTHATSMISVAAAAASVSLALLDMRAPRQLLRRFIGVNLAVAALAAPVVTAMVLQTESPNIDWMPHFGLDRLLIVARMLMIGPMVRSDLGLLGSNILLLTELGLASVTAILSVGVARRHIGNPQVYALVLVLPLLFLAAVSIVSLVRPILIPRITIWTLVPICLAMGFIVTSSASVRLRTLTMSLVAACLGLGLWNNCITPAQHKPDWRALLSDNPADVADGPLLVGGPHAGALGLTFYSGDNIRRPLHQWITQSDWPRTLADRLERDASGVMPVSTQEILQAIRAGSHVRVYLDTDDYGLIDSQLAAQPEYADARIRFYPGLIVLDW
jgi:4-amino-4-deoxy-L-arabinose transferase-like glycosyltransferase